MGAVARVNAVRAAARGEAQTAEDFKLILVGPLTFEGAKFFHAGCPQSFFRYRAKQDSNANGLNAKPWFSICAMRACAKLAVGKLDSHDQAAHVYVCL
jgi:hypothetical protein